MDEPIYFSKPLKPWIAEIVDEFLSRKRPEATPAQRTACSHAQWDSVHQWCKDCGIMREELVVKRWRNN